MKTWEFNATGTPAEVLSQLNAYTEIPPHIKTAFKGIIAYSMLPKIAATFYELTSSGTVGGPEYSQTYTTTHNYK